MSDLPAPYVRREPDDLIRAEDWNEIQSRARDEIHTHQHTGEDGHPIPRAGIAEKAIDGSRIDPDATVELAGLNVTGSAVTGPLNVNGIATARRLHVRLGESSHGALEIRTAGSASSWLLWKDRVDNLALMAGVDDGPASTNLEEVISFTRDRRVKVTQLEASTSVSVGGLEVETAHIGETGQTRSTITMPTADSQLDIVQGAQKVLQSRSDGSLVLSGRDDRNQLILGDGQVTIGAEAFTGDAAQTLNVEGQVYSYGRDAGLRLQNRDRDENAGTDWNIWADYDGRAGGNGLVFETGGVVIARMRERELMFEGPLRGTVKTFLIPHPLDRDRQELIHACLEGPEAAVYYRGEAQLDGGSATIELPPYFEALVAKEGRTVQLTPLWDDVDEPCSPLAASRVVDGRFRVRAIDERNPSQRFCWEVKAVRADLPALEVERPRVPRE